MGTLVADIGLNFQNYPSLVDQFSLSLWSHWALIHVMIKMAAVNLGYLGVADILTISIRYQSDFQTLLKVLRSNLKASLLLQFREGGYFEYPVKDEKRWWVDAYVRVVEVGPKKWKSKGLHETTATYFFNGLSIFL